MNEKIKNGLVTIVQSFEQLLNGHPNSIYQELLDTYKMAKVEYERNGDSELLKSRIKWTSRTIIEAPPYDEELGLKILDQIDELHSYLFE